MFVLEQRCATLGRPTMLAAEQVSKNERKQSDEVHDDASPFRTRFTARAGPL